MRRTLLETEAQDSIRRPEVDSERDAMEVIRGDAQVFHDAPGRRVGVDEHSVSRRGRAAIERALQWPLPRRDRPTHRDGVVRDDDGPSDPQRTDEVRKEVPRRPRGWALALAEPCERRRLRARDLGLRPSMLLDRRWAPQQPSPRRVELGEPVKEHLREPPYARVPEPTTVDRDAATAPYHVEPVPFPPLFERPHQVTT